MASNLSARVFKAMSVFGGVQAVTVLSSIVRTKVIAVWLGAAGVGLLSLYFTLFQFASTIAEAGIRSSAVRDISQSPASRLPLTATVVRRWCLGLGVCGMVALLCASPLLSLGYFGNLGSTCRFAMLAPMLLLMNITAGEGALMQGTGRLTLLANTSVMTAVGGTLLSLPMFIYLGMDGIVPSIGVFVAVQCAGMWLWRVRTPRCVPYPSRGEVLRLGRGFVSLGVYMTISTLVTQGVSLLFIAYLQRTGGMDEVGYFQAGFTLVSQYIGLIFTAISMEYYPRLAAVTHSRRATGHFVAHEMRLVLWALLGPATLFIAASTLIVTLLYKESFGVITPFVVIATVGTVFRAVSWCLAIVILARGDGRTYIVTETLSSAAYLIVNIIMYRSGGIAGMGVAYIIWYAIYTLIVGVVYIRRYDGRLPRSVVSQAAAVAAVIALCAALHLMCGPVVSGIVAVPATALSLTMLVSMMRNKRRRSAV